MKTLVTGATGFLGRYVVDYLLSLDHAVIATAAGSMEKANELFHQPKNLKYIQKNLNDREENYFLFFEKPDRVIHLSWEGLPNYRELFHIERNLPSNYYFVKNMVSHGLDNITITGTCFEYGLLEGCLSEDMDTRPATNYGLAKDTLRKFVEALQKEFTFNFKWLRLFYPFGAGQGPNSLYSQMENAVSAKNTTFNMSAGEQLRDYLPVKMIAEYIVKAALQDKIGGIINCCGGKPIAVRSFVENYFKERHYPIELNLGYYPYSDYEPLAFWGDTRKLMTLLAAGESSIMKKEEI
jgi:dTDP-6-deoxy-L-talose 4-dehydrogenase (NAD+)